MQFGVRGVTQRYRAQPHRAVGSGAEGTGSGAICFARGHACGQRAERGARRNASDLGGRRQEAHEPTHPIGGSSDDLRRHGEAVLSRCEIKESDLRTGAHRSLAHAVREQRKLGTQMTADDEQPGQRIDRVERQAERRDRHASGITAEIALAQPMVEVRRTEAARDTRRQMKLFEGERGMGQQARRRTRRREAARRRAERGLPVDLAPCTALAQPGLRQAVGREQTFVAETVAVGDPGLVHRVVITRHDALQTTTQHMAEKVRAESVVRRDQRRLRHLP